MIVSSVTRLDQPLEQCGRAVAIGVFDGMHIGHRAVIGPLVQHLDLRPTVLAFFGIPGKHPFSLASREEWQTQVSRMTVEETVEMPFSLVRDLSPAAFVKTVLVDLLNAKLVRVGENFRFGKDAAGDTALLAALCKEQGIAVEIAPSVLIDGQTVSSTRIRTAVEQGDMQMARRLLGRPFTIDFEVQDGQHLGRTLGTPTINQPLPIGFVRPRFGVYATVALIDGCILHGVTNVGVRPTVGAPGPLAETWLPDFIGDLYHKRVSVMFVKFLRDETKFEGLTALKEQITKDEQMAREAVFPAPTGHTRAVLFDFDDTLQDSDIACEKAFRRLMPRWFPHISAEECERRVSEIAAIRNGGYMFERYAARIRQDAVRKSLYCYLFEDMLARWGETGDPAAMVRDLFRVFPWCGAALPGVYDLLTRLHSAGIAVGYITNGNSGAQGMKLDNAGLRPYADVALVSGDFGIHKPEPALFRLAAALIGIHPADCVFVGDHYQNDIAGSQSAGMRSVLVTAYSREKTYPAAMPHTAYAADIEEFL